MLGTTAFILFIMLVATANLCLGFAAAVAFGVGPQTWPVLKFKSAAAEATEHQEVHAPEPAAQPVAAHTPAPPEPPAQIRLTATEIEEPADTAEELSLENALTQVARGFDMFEAELADWDQRRREMEPDVDYLTNSAIELRGLATSYLEQFQLCLEPLAKLPAFDPPEIAAQAEIRAVEKELADQLSLRCAELNAVRFESGDDLLANEQLTTALTQLLTLLRQTRNRLEEPVTVLVRSEGALGSLASTLIEQAQASLLGRLCFEHLWQVAKEGGQSGCLAMLDVDGLTQCNTLHGPLLAKRLLRVLGDVVRETVPLGTPVTRMQGKQFVICLDDSSVASAAEMIEQIRQKIEHTTFQANDREIQATVSAGIVAILPGESSTTALARLRGTIGEAKSYGRNRTFVCEEQTPTPLAPSKLTIASQVIPL